MMRKVTLLLDPLFKERETVSVQSDLHFCTLNDFNTYFKALFDNCPASFATYEVAVSQEGSRWMPVEESVIGNWLSLRMSKAPRWFIRRISQQPETTKDYAAHAKLETVMETMQQMRAYLEEEMDDIKQKTENDIGALKAELSQLKTKLNVSENDRHSTPKPEAPVGTEDAPQDADTSMAVPGDTSVQITDESEPVLGGGFYSTFVKFTVPKGSEDALLPTYITSLLKELETRPVVYGAVSEGRYEPCLYTSSGYQRISRHPDMDKFYLGFNEDDVKSTPAGSEAASTSMSWASAVGLGDSTAPEPSSPKPSVVKYPKPFAKTSETFPLLSARSPSTGKTSTHNQAHSLAAEFRGLALAQEFVTQLKDEMRGPLPAYACSNPRATESCVEKDPKADPAPSVDAQATTRGFSAGGFTFGKVADGIPKASPKLVPCSQTPTPGVGSATASGVSAAATKGATFKFSFCSSSRPTIPLKSTNLTTSSIFNFGSTSSSPNPTIPPKPTTQPSSSAFHFGNGPLGKVVTESKQSNTPLTTPSEPPQASPDAVATSSASPLMTMPAPPSTTAVANNTSEPEYIIIDDEHSGIMEEMKKTSKVDDSEMDHHCNSCNGKIEMSRVHCVDCEDFDCCQDCYGETNKTHPSDHTFELYVYK